MGGELFGALPRLENSVTITRTGILLWVAPVTPSAKPTNGKNMLKVSTEGFYDNDQR